MLDIVRLRVRYRQPVIRTWAFFEVVPELRFRERDDYDSRARRLRDGLGPAVRLDLYFGSDPI